MQQTEPETLRSGPSRSKSYPARVATHRKRVLRRVGVTWRFEA